MEEISAGGCAYVYLVSNFNFSRIRDNEQLHVVPLIMRMLRMAPRVEIPRDRGVHRGITTLGGL